MSTPSTTAPSLANSSAIVTSVTSSIALKNTLGLRVKIANLTSEEKEKRGNTYGKICSQFQCSDSKNQNQEKVSALSSSGAIGSIKTSEYKQ